MREECVKYSKSLLEEGTKRVCIWQLVSIVRCYRTLPARVYIGMRFLIIVILSLATFAQTPIRQIPPDDAVLIREFYHLASEIQDRIWTNWSRTPTPLLLVTPNAEFLTHFPKPPAGFEKTGDDFYARARQLPTNLLATMPVFGPPSVIVIGEPKHTASKSSTRWLITLMHEHFHQLQYSQPGYSEALQNLGLRRGDNTGMWMLNYPFPYEQTVIAQSFAHLRDRLFGCVNEADGAKFAKLAQEYFVERRKFFAQLSADDHKYLSFQLWQEGIARYTEIKAAETAAEYRPTAEYAALPDFEPFASYSARARADTLSELKQIELAKKKREVVYAFGAAEGMLLDRRNAKWKERYFEHLLSTDAFFDE